MRICISITCAFFSISCFAAGIELDRQWSFSEYISGYSTVLFSQTGDDISVLSGQAHTATDSRAWLRSIESKTGSILDSRQFDFKTENYFFDATASKNLEVILSGTILWRDRQAVDLRGLLGLNFIRDSAISPDGRYLAVGIDPYNTLIYDVATLAQVFQKRTNASYTFSNLNWSETLGGFVFSDGYHSQTGQSIRDRVLLWRPGYQKLATVISGFEEPNTPSPLMNRSALSPLGKYLVRWSEKPHSGPTWGNSIPYGSVDVFELATGAHTRITEFAESTDEVTLYEAPDRLVIKTRDSASKETIVWDSKNLRATKWLLDFDLINVSTGLLQMPDKKHGSLTLADLDRPEQLSTVVKVCQDDRAIDLLKTNPAGDKLIIMCSSVLGPNETLMFHLKME